MEETNYHQIEAIERDNWWYQGKRHLLAQIITKIRAKKKLVSALDIGCGVGSNLAVLQRFIPVVKGIDFSPTAVAFCHKKGYTMVSQGDVCNLKLKEKFDVVLCSELLEHVDDRKAIREIANVVAPSGILLISVPAHQFLWNDNDDISHHQRRYEKKELRQLLQQDFTIHKMSYWNSTLFLPAFFFYKVHALYKLGKKNSNHKTNNLNLIPAFLNKILYNLLKAENKIFTVTNLPQGISLVAVCVKKN